MLNTLGADLYMPVRTFSGMSQKTLVSDLDTTIVHLDLKRLCSGVICNSLLLYDSCLQPFSTVWALYDNSVSNFKLVNGRSPLLSGEIELVFISLFDHLLVINLSWETELSFRAQTVENGWKQAP